MDELGAQHGHGPYSETTEKRSSASATFQEKGRKLWAVIGGTSRKPEESGIEPSRT
jgi:hypothetical protein